MAVNLLDAIAVTNQAPRTTDPVNGLGVNVGAYTIFAVYVKNTLDVQLTVTVEGSLDAAFSDPITLDSAVGVAAEGGKFYRVFSDPLPYVRVVVTPEDVASLGSVAAKVLGKA